MTVSEENGHTTESLQTEDWSPANRPDEEGYLKVLFSIPPLIPKTRQGGLGRRPQLHSLPHRKPLPHPQPFVDSRFRFLRAFRTILLRALNQQRWLEEESLKPPALHTSLRR